MSIAALWNLYLSWRRYRASLRALSRLDDRMLQDIGLNRSQIPGVAWEASTR